MLLEPVCALEDEMLTIRPQCAAFMSARVSCVTMIGPRTLTL